MPLLHVFDALSVCILSLTVSACLMHQRLSCLYPPPLCFAAVALGHEPAKPQFAGALRDDGTWSLKGNSSKRDGGRTTTVPLLRSALPGDGCWTVCGATKTHVQPGTKQQRDPLLARPLKAITGRASIDAAGNLELRSPVQVPSPAHTTFNGQRAEIVKLEVNWCCCLSSVDC